MFARFLQLVIQYHMQYIFSYICKFLHVSTVEDFRFVNFRIYLVALGTFAIATDAFVIAGILPAIAHSFHVTVGTAGQLVTVYALLYGFGAPLLAALLAPFSR